MTNVLQYINARRIGERNKLVRIDVPENSEVVVKKEYQRLDTNTPPFCCQVEQ
ncbi:hypothetical protein KM1_101780 [Entamoeba histolytica HM-3:IMSS]|uniref:Uncharacterized protein n=1 Tax=Entamoeba histolytica HM-3:IMSS TaxID=885315 RepID=M7WBR9_ENTHI|nr:hypothetical protein KM1_101780 [Entamoeba histolytica HM-3:IMSS]